MKSKTSFFNMARFKDTAKRYWWFGLFAFILQLFTIVVPVVMMQRSYMNSIQNFSTPEEVQRVLKELARSAFGPDRLTGEMVVMMLLGMAAGIVFFSYMHNRQQVNFFHSQPVRREEQLTSRLLSAVLLVLVPYAVNRVLVLVIGACYGLLGYVTAVQVALRIVEVIIGFMAMLSLGMLAATLTGTVFAQIEMLLLLLFAGLGVYSCTNFLLSAFLKTYVPSFVKAYMLSPFVHLVIMGGNAATGWELIGYAIFSAVCCGLALLLYRLRPSECAGTPVIFRKATEPLIKLVACYIASILMASLLGGISGDLPMYIFGLVMGAVLCHMFCEGQFNKDFKSMFKHLPSLLVFIAAMGIFTACAALDVFHYDDYVPSADDVSSVSVAISTDNDTQPLDDRVSYIRNAINSDLGGVLPGQETLEDYLSVSDTASVRSAIDMAGLITADENYADRTLLSENRYATDNYGIINPPTLTYMYTLKNGRRVSRVYNSVDVSKVMQPLQAYVSGEQYRAKHKVFQLTSDVKFEYVNLEWHKPNGEYDTKLLSGKEALKLFDAIKTDVAQYGLSLDSPKAASVTLQYQDEEALERGYFKNTSVKIYSNFTNTLALLKEMGVEITLFDDAYISSLKELRVYGESDRGAPPVLYTTSDPAEIKALLTAEDAIGTEAYDDSITVYSSGMIECYTQDDLKAEAEYNAMLAQNGESAKEKGMYSGPMQRTVWLVYSKVPQSIRALLDKNLQPEG